MAATTPIKWAFANAAVIARARETDLTYIVTLEERLSTLLKSLLGLPLYYRLMGGVDEGLQCRSLAALLYYGLTTGIGNQTLGEEYCHIVPVDVRRGNWTPWWKRWLWALWQGPLQTHLERLPWFSQVLFPLHLALFYWQGKYPDMGRRLLGMRYIHYPRIATVMQRWDRLYAVLGALVAGVALMQAYRLILQRRISSSSQSAYDKFDLGKGGGAVSGVEGPCPMCLQTRLDPAVAACGHVFCWNCIVTWLRQRPECPLCRIACTSSSLYCLHQDQDS